MKAAIDAIRAVKMCIRDSAKIEPVSIFGGGADWNIPAGTFKAIYETYNGKTTPEAYIQANKGVAEAALNDVMKVVNQFK